MKILYLNNNLISNIQVLEKFNFSELTELWLYNNNIEDITPLKKFKIGRIEVLSLFGNKIDKDKFANTIKQMQETIKDFQFKEVIF